MAYMRASSSGKKVDLGPTGETVSRNVARLRGGMQYKQLSEMLTELGRPIPPLGLRRIENDERRVDADDLVALSIALGVTPNALLLPHAEDGESVSITGSEGIEFRRLWKWAEGTQPLAETGRNNRADWIAFLERSSPRFLDDAVKQKLFPDLVLNAGDGSDGRPAVEFAPLHPAQEERDRGDG